MNKDTWLKLLKGIRDFLLSLILDPINLFLIALILLGMVVFKIWIDR